MRLLFSPILLFVLAFTLFAPALPAAAGLAAMSVYPSREELVIPPGEAQTFSVTVANPGKESLRFQVYLSDWTLLPNGDMNFLPAGKIPTSAHRMISFSPAQFVLLPDQTQQVRINVAVPAGTAGGEYHGMLFFETIPPQAPKKREGTTILFSQRVGNTIYVAVPPHQKRATVTGLAYLPPREKSPPRIGLALQNLGTIHVRASGTLKICRMDGGVVEELPLNEIPILRESKRLYQAPLSKELAPGKYRAQLSLDYGGDEVIEAESVLER